MGSCPFCRAQILPGDSICYSCGRVISGSSGMDGRVKGEFMRSSTRSAKKGVAPRHSMKASKSRRGKKKRSRINQLGLIALVAFIFFTPDARQFVLEKWAELQAYITEAMAPSQAYPLSAEYTVVRSVDLWNNHSSQTSVLQESIPIPSDITSNERGDFALMYEDGTEADKSTIQEIISMELRIDGETITIPAEGKPHKEKSNAYVTSKGNHVWWPSMNPLDNPNTAGENEMKDTDGCRHGPCVRVSFDIPADTHDTIDFAVTLESTSHTWWHSTKMDGKVEGKSEGTSVSRSGTFEDIENRRLGVYSNDFASSQRWYDRGVIEGVNHGWAIDGRQSSAPTVYQTAANIMASLPSSLQDNAYAYARATFDWLNANVPYDGNAPGTARSGEQCLDAGTGDCDEQSNAFMSIMRIQGVPTWYVFGALADSEFDSWQGHAWAYIMLPMSDEWCEDNEVILSSCYVEASVDVVNHKWLVHTPTAFIDWIDNGDKDGERVAGYYRGGNIDGGDLDRVRSFYTEEYEVSSTTWKNKWIAEDL